MGKVIRFKQAEPNFDMAKRFLDMLDPTGAFTFQTFDDNIERKAQRKKTKTRDPLARTFHGTLEEHWDALYKLNGKGAGVYVTISLTDLEGRKLENIVEPRAVFVDYDDRGPDPLDEVLAYDPPPTMVVNTSPSKWHAYWVVEEMPTQDFSRFQKGLAEKFGTDDNVADVSRVMRIPGTLHCKSDVPTLVTLSYMDDEAVYAYEDLKAKFHFKRERTRKTSVAEKQFQASREEVEALLQRMIEEPQEDFATRDPWLKIGMALKNWDEDEGLELWLWFCEQACGDAFDEEECVDKWENDFKRSANARTLATYCQSYEYSIATHTRDEPEDDFAHIPKVEKEEDDEDELEDWEESLLVTDELIREIDDEVPIVDKLVYEKNITTIVSKPGTGKTTILMHLLPEMTSRGFDVYYLHGDVSSADLRIGLDRVKTANDAGPGVAKYLAPMQFQGVNMRAVRKLMERDVKKGRSLEKRVYVVDTLKQMCDMMSKNDTAQFFQLCRKLTTLGATVVLLGHANKWNDSEGWPKYEGTGDVEADSDRLLYFIATDWQHSEDDEDQRFVYTSVYSSSKCRGDFKERTWKVQRGQAWDYPTFIDTHEAAMVRGTQVENDSMISEAIVKVLEDAGSGGMTQSQLVKICNSKYDTPFTKTRSVLVDNKHGFWLVEKRKKESNKRVYTLNPLVSSKTLKSGVVLKVEDQDDEE